MKTTIRFLTAVLLLAASVGCAVQRKAPKPEAAALYAQALKALEQRRFVIEADEFRFSERKTVEPANGSSISMKGNWGVARYSPSLFPLHDFFYRLGVEGTAEIVKGNQKRNGDIEYVLKIADEDNKRPWLVCTYQIMLFHNTNKCFIQLGDFGNITFTGRIVPLKE